MATRLGSSSGVAAGGINRSVVGKLDQRWPEPLRELLRIKAPAQFQHPLKAVLLRCTKVIAIQVEEGRHRREGRALVALNEDLALGDSVREDRGLQSHVRLPVVSVAAWTAQSCFQSLGTPELVASLFYGALENAGVHGENPLEVEIEGVLQALLPRPVVLGKEVERAAVARNRTIDRESQSSLGDDSKVAAWQGFHHHRRAIHVAEVLELSRDRDDVAVADPPHPDRPHDTSIYG